jgi:hypothetical protein
VSAQEVTVTRTTPLALAAALAVGALITTACGSSSSSSSTATNGEASKTATQILSDTRAAAKSASSVHVVINGLPGTVSSATLDLSRNTGATGTLTFKGQPVNLVIVDNQTYFKGSAGFWTAATGSSASAKLFADKWLKIPSATAASSVSSITSLTDMNTFFTGLLAASGKLTNAGATTFNGQPAVELKSSKGGSLFVATTGQPYPIGLKQGSAQGNGQGTFTNWNVPVTVTAPAGAVSLPTG